MRSRKHASMHTLSVRTVEGGRFLGPLALLAVRWVNFCPAGSMPSKLLESVLIQIKIRNGSKTFKM